MLELGNESATQHKALAHLIAEINIDSVFCCGVEMQHLYQALPFQKRAGYERYPENLIPHVLAYLREGDVVYVKGSKGSRVSIIVDYLMQNYLHRMQNMKALDNI
jgi:UDP-N-acetylmuramoyl-tripeptide--D-alanyl-D-alanine ligase